MAIALSLALGAAVLAGCGGSAGEAEGGGGHPDYARALAGAPAPLAALYKGGDRLLPGGKRAFERQIAALHGYPVVVNVWASWCGPCRFEFPTLQALSARFGKQVAFIGVNSEDSADAARTFLSEAPLPYPSYSDPDKEIKDSLGAGFGLPDTAFYDRRGKLVFLKQGPFSDQDEMRADLERYALGTEAGAQPAGARSG